MISFITVECPQCKQISDIYLSAEASYVILNCPACMSHIIYHKNICARLNRQQVSNIMKAEENDSVEQMLSDIVNRERSRIEKRKVANSKPNAPLIIKEGNRIHPISEDDVINLRISLATCKDCAEFIALI